MQKAIINRLAGKVLKVAKNNLVDNVDSVDNVDNYIHLEITHVLDAVRLRAYAILDEQRGRD